MDEVRGRHVVVLAKAFPPVTGGVEQYSLQVVLAYLRAGWTVTVLTQTAGDRGWRVEHSADGDFRVWNTGPGSQAAVFARMLAHAVRLRDRRSVSVVHSTTWRVGIVAALAFRGRPQVVTVHGREVLNFPRVLGLPMRYVLRRASVVMAVSDATMVVARGALRRARPRGRWVVSYNGLTYRAAAADSRPRTRRDRVEMLSLSRLVARKNVDASIRALAGLEDSLRSDVHLRIAGLGPERPRLEGLVRELGVEDRVTFLGYVDDADIPGLYREADIFLHPHSHVGEGRDFEGFGIVIADAMSFSCACIVGDQGGPRELVDDGRTGILVDGNDVQQVTGALRRLVESAEERTELGRSARAEALERFSWDSHVRPVLDVTR